MSALFGTAGPIEHYVRFRNGQVYHVGESTLAPEVERRPAYIDIKNDLSGRSVPMQKVFDGSQHVITTTLNRFDLTAYRLLSESDPLNGIDTKYQRGSLTLGSTDFELILVNSFAVQGAPMFGVVPVGRRYYSCVLVGARESTVGSRVCEVSLVIEANGLFSAADRSFSIFTEDPNLVTAGLPNPT